MDKNKEKSFFLKQTIQEMIILGCFNKKDLISTSKIDIPNETKIFGNRAIFQELLYGLIVNAYLSYGKEFLNKIILFTSQIENEKEVSVSVTSGGKGVSFFQKKLVDGEILLFKNDQKKIDLFSTNEILKKEFGGKLKIFSQKNKGLTVKCFFPLAQ